MDILINEKPADITLDTEKTLGDVLAGIEQWVSPLGNRIRDISINGGKLREDALAGEFGRDIAEIKTLGIELCSFRELAAEALGDLYEACAMYGNAPFSGRAQIAENWEKSAAARFLASDIPEMYSLSAAALSGEGLPAQDLALLIEERLRELADPGREIANSENLVRNIAQRMEGLPLDLQTGKDQRAAETVQLFSRMGEKLFRLLNILKSEGLSLDALIVGDLPARSFMKEFNAVLTELSGAYESRDTVLVGDLAEYELSPRLLQFFSALKNVTEMPAPYLIAP